MTAILLLSPKYIENVAATIRLAHNFAIPTVLIWKPRFEDPARVPREIRMYRDVAVVDQNRAHPLAGADRWGKDIVAVERTSQAENLADFDHPKDPIYLFGPEDGAVEQTTRQHCSRFVQIPVTDSLNLATAVAITLWDREKKLLDRTRRQREWEVISRLQES